MKTIPWSTKPLVKAQDFPTMFVRMNHVESARTQTHFIVGTAASLATSFAQCLDFANVCDGKVACGDGSDEENCKDQSGSWMCQGAIQQRSQPCL